MRQNSTLDFFGSKLDLLISFFSALLIKFLYDLIKESIDDGKINCSLLFIVLTLIGVIVILFIGVLHVNKNKRLNESALPTHFFVFRESRPTATNKK